MVHLPTPPSIRRAVLLVAASIAARGAAENAHDTAIGIRRMNDGGISNINSQVHVGDIMCVQTYAGHSNDDLQYSHPKDDGLGGKTCADGATTVCVRGHSGLTLQYSYPTDNGSGGKTCAGDVDPSQYHTTSNVNLCSTGMFGTQDECCKAYPQACGHPSNNANNNGGGNNHNGANGNHNGDISNINSQVHVGDTVCVQTYEGHNNDDLQYSYPKDDGLGGKTCANGATFVCVRGHSGPALQYSYPTDNGSGGKTCAGDVDPSQYHTTGNLNLCSTGMFGTQDQCCKAYPQVCQHPANSANNNGGGNNHNSANGNHHPGISNINSLAGTTVCVRGYDGHMLQYSYPTDDGAGGKECPDDVDPSEYHTTDNLCSTGAFGTEAECCKAHPRACGHPSNNVDHNGGGDNQNGASGNNANLNVGNGNENNGSNTGENIQDENQVGALTEPENASASKESGNGLIYGLLSLLVGGMFAGLAAGYFVRYRKKKARTAEETKGTEKELDTLPLEECFRDTPDSEIV